MAILSCNFNSACLGRMISFQAILPIEEVLLHSGEKDCKHIEPLKTLYLLHGITGNDMDWLVGTRIAHYAARKNLAVIMPAGENGFYTDNNSTNRFGEYIGNELVQATRAMFHLSEKREDTFIGGLSMGGYGALRNGLKYSDTFGKIIALSSALITDDAVKSTNEPEQWHFAKREYFEMVFGNPDTIKGGDSDVKELAKKYAENIQMYLACGTEDVLLEKNRDYIDYLKSINANYDYIEGPGGHDWDFWDIYIEKAIEWIFQG